MNLKLSEKLTKKTPKNILNNICLIYVSISASIPTGTHTDDHRKWSGGIHTQLKRFAG